MSAFECRRLRKSFGRTQPILQDLDLSIQAGELLVIQGPSGVGKTTFLRLLAGLTTPDFGTILRNGIEITHEPPEDRGIGFLFQNPALLPNLRVREQLELPGRLAGEGRSLRRVAAERAAALVGLTHLLDRSTVSLSGGERQRVALARALVRADRLRLLLLDEPFASLDLLTRSDLRGLLRRLQRELRLTSVLVTHDPAEASALGDRIAVLAEGRIVQVGTPTELFAEPTHRLTAALVGWPPRNLLRHEGILWAVPADGFRVATSEVPDLLVIVRMCERFGPLYLLTGEADGATLRVLLMSDRAPDLGSMIPLVIERSRRIRIREGECK